MKKTGRVLLVKNNIVSMTTAKGEFVKVKVKGNPPKRGDIYTGNVYVDYVTYVLFLILSITIVIGGVFGHLYFSTANSIIFDIPPAIKIKTNKWNYIVSCTASTKNGMKLLDNIDVRNTPLNEGLRSITDKAIELKLIKTSKNGNNNFSIIYINGKTNPELTSFENYAFSKQVNFKINWNGKDLTSEH